jgi:branched-chain amino acid aminotransferase
MEIPMEFTPEFFVNEAKKLADAMGHINARVRLQLVRIANGKYTPVGDVGVSWWMELEPLEKSDYSLNERGLKVELFKDHYVQPGLLSTLKSSNSLLYVLAGIFAQENGYDQMLLINDEKMVVESNLGNIFVLKDDVLSTPPLESGALRGVFRKNLLSFAEDLKIKVVEEKINPFSLQKADEIWLTNTVQGVQWVEQYRKKVYSGEKAKELVAMLNRKLNVLGNL